MEATQASGSLAIRVNGSLREVAAGSSYADLVGELVGEARMVAVERNGEILPRARWRDTPVGADDSIEIVRFVQGG